MDDDSGAEMQLLSLIKSMWPHLHSATTGILSIKFQNSKLVCLGCECQLICTDQINDTQNIKQLNQLLQKYCARAGLDTPPFGEIRIQLVADNIIKIWGTKSVLVRERRNGGEERPQGERKA